MRNRGRNEDAKMEINIGTMGNVPKTGKEKEYLELRAKITNSILIRMRELLNVCQTELEFFSRLDDEGISLMYLVALGITNEENISSYQTMRKRGIDTYSVMEEAKGKRIDSSYLREITALEKEYPVLLNTRGENIENTLLTPQEKLALIQKQLGTSENVEPEKRDSKSAEVQAISHAVDLDIDLNFEEEEEESFSKEDSEAWRKVLKTIQENTDKVNQGVMVDNQEPLPEDNVKNIFILSNEFEVPYAEGYRFVFVKDLSNMGMFTAKKTNLLVVTQSVPKFLMMDFLSWMKGLMNSGDKYRITTLKNSPVRHSLIQEELFDLSKDSLDNFYERHENDEYIGDGVGIFYDLTSKIT